MNQQQEVIAVLRNIADRLESGKDVGITMAYVIPSDVPGETSQSQGGHTVVETYGMLATVLGMMELEKTYAQAKWLQSQLEAENAVAMAGKLEELKVALEKRAQEKADAEAPMQMIGAEVSVETVETPVAAGDPSALRPPPSTSPVAEASAAS